jgi:hypothetical protein
MQRFFAQDTVEYGGKWMRGYRIQCNTCQRIEKTPYNTTQSSGAGNDDDITARRVQEKFERLGWHPGKREQDDLCPECYAELNDDKPHNGTDIQPSDNANAMVVAPGPVDAEVLPPAKANGMTREDRRIIFAKLEDVYDCEATGYEDGWSDGRVARYLHVPRDWVARIREENFGSFADNPELRGVINEAREIFSQIREKQGEVQRVVAGIMAMVDQAKAIQADVQRLAGRLGPLEKKINELLAKAKG